MRIYVSGPMTGMPDNNIHAFRAAAERLRSQGHFVINPHDFTPMFGSDEEIEKSFKNLYAFYAGIYEDDIDITQAKHKGRLANAIMAADLAAVSSCDAIYLLKGWETSRGARKELAHAIAHGLKIMQEGE